MTDVLQFGNVITFWSLNFIEEYGLATLLVWIIFLQHLQQPVLLVTIQSVEERLDLVDGLSLFLLDDGQVVIDFVLFFIKAKHISRNRSFRSI